MLVVECPKRLFDENDSAQSFYDYYAGYSSSFAESLIRHTPLDPNSLVLDPWNGSGTTVRAAITTGHRALGIDLNPAMVTVAKARMLAHATTPSIEPLFAQISAAARNHVTNSFQSDPLFEWFSPGSAEAIRAVERGINEVLVGAWPELWPVNVDALSDVAAFFYTALFKVVRDALTPLRTSNPTWHKRPKGTADRISIGVTALRDRLGDVLHELTSPTLDKREVELQASARNYLIRTGNSASLPVASRSTDLVLTSPPYCTRIDYAVATAGELAVLGYGQQGGFEELRSELMGTTKVPKDARPADSRWGTTCNQFLDQLRMHSSVASDTYYLKNHLHYFRSLFASVAEIARILKDEGIAVIVVQDSYYKDIWNDLPTIVTDMARANNLELFQRDDFEIGTSLGNINKRSAPYVSSKKPVEAVLGFHMTREGAA